MKPQGTKMDSETTLRNSEFTLNIPQIDNHQNDDDTPTNTHLETSPASSFALPIVQKLLKIVSCFRVLAFTVTTTILLLTLLLLVSVPLIPLLLSALVVTRLLQYFKKGHEYYKLVELNFLIRLWILIDVIFALLSLYIALCITNHIQSVQHTLILGLPRIKWFMVICIMYGFYSLAFLLNIAARYVVPPLPVEYTGSGLIVREAICEIINCLVFWWAKHEFMRRVHVLRHQQIFGLETRKWISAVLLVIIGNNIISIFTHLIVWSLRKFCVKVKSQALDESRNPNDTGARDKITRARGVLDKIRALWLGKKDKLFHTYGLVYWAKGVKWSVNFILTSLMFLLVWVFYFCPHLSSDGDEKVKRFLHLGTMTFVCVLLCSFLWLIKTCFMRSWEARTVFSRLKDKILRKKVNTFFVGMVGCDQEHYLLCLGNEQVFAKKRDEIKALLIEASLMAESVTMFDLQQLAQCLIVAKTSLLDDEAKSKIEAWWNDGDQSKFDKYKKHFWSLKDGKDPAEHCRKRMRPRTALLQRDISAQKCNQGTEVSDKKTSDDQSIEGKTMDYSRDSCISLVNILTSARDAYNCLNNIVGGFIIVAIILLWLLVTGLATIQLFILSTSPLLAATFIFGETLKNLFQGMIFVYAVNPFDVGDLCAVEEHLMEVKSVGLWKTTFTKIEKLGILEEIIYPNSELAKKTLTNYKTDFDWDESMDFDVGLLDDKRVKQLKNDIERHLNAKEDTYIPNSHSVAIFATGDKIQIHVHFKYVKSVKRAGTYFACLQRKDKLRSEFSLYVHNLVQYLKNASDSKVAPSLMGDGSGDGNLLEKKELEPVTGVDIASILAPRLFAQGSSGAPESPA